MLLSRVADCGDEVSVRMENISLVGFWGMGGGGDGGGTSIIEEV